MDGEPLVFSALPGDDTLLSAAVEGGALILSGLAAGETIITVSASGGLNLPIPHPVHVLVHAEPFKLAFGNHHFSEWAADEPAGRYPAHMIFLQSNIDDPGLEDPLWFAYRIPDWDAANSADVAFPYNASSRSRINGLGAECIGCINTGRGRDLGVAILTLDSTGAEDIQVTWTAGTIKPNSRDYELRLQYRVGLADNWSDLFHEGKLVAYPRNETAGHSESIGPVTLPPETAGAPPIQLRWVYHHVEGTSGTRPILRLADVRVESTGEPLTFAKWVALAIDDPAKRDDPAYAGPGADPFGTGVPNLLRYACGLGWAESFVGRLSAPRLSTDGLTLRVPFNPSLTDIIYRGHASPPI